MHPDATRFDARADAPAQHRQYRPIEKVRALREATKLRHRASIRAISPRTESGVACKKKRRKSTVLVGRFARPVGAPVRNQANRPTEGVQGYHGCHWSMPPGEYCGRYMKSVTHTEVFSEFFHRQLAEKVA
jgi:hypothetical protein